MPADAVDASADRIIDLYSRRVAEWDAERGRSLMEKAWLDAFLALIPPGGAVLDLGCGMGEPIGRYLIEQGVRLTGVDAAPGSIERARARLPGHDWIVADMRGLDLDRSFDGLIAWHSAFHLCRDDLRALFGVYARHVLPGGVLMFTSGPHEGEAIGDWHGEALYHDSLSPEENRERLKAAGFTVLDTRLNDPDCGGATVWLARRDMSD